MIHLAPPSADDAALDVVVAVCHLQRTLEAARARGSSAVHVASILQWTERTLTAYERAACVVARCNAPGGVG